MDARRCAGYIRVSSRAQDFATQQDAIERAAAARGDSIAAFFSEKRRGTGSYARPELDELIGAVHRGEYSRVYVFRLDRFTRRGARDCVAVVDALQSRGCDLVSTAEPWLQLDGPFAELIISVLGWAAKQEAVAIGDRISAARTRIEETGGAWGRRPRCAPSTIAQIERLAAEGKTHREIAQTVRVKRQTVGNVLAKKGAYRPRGETRQKWLDADADPTEAK